MVFWEWIVKDSQEFAKIPEDSCPEDPFCLSFCFPDIRKAVCHLLVRECGSAKRMLASDKTYQKLSGTG
eukprot:5953620-Pyramimonas_sp.AAC.1